MKTVCLTAPATHAMSGVSTHVTNLLASDLARSYRLVHYQVGREGRAEGPLGRAARLVAGPIAFRSFLRRERVDLVHFNSSLDKKAFWRDIVLAGAARECGARVVFQVHGGDLIEDFIRRHGVLAGTVRRLCSVPDSWVFLYQAERESLARVRPGAVAQVIPNGVDTTPFEGPPFPGGSGPVVFGYIGRLASNKGIGDALGALASLKREGRLPEIVYRIAGDGPDEARLRTIAAGAGLGPVVEFTGPLFDERKIEFLRRQDVLLFPSHGEGLPYTLLESMAAGAAVIATRLGGMADALVEGENALFVTPRDPASIAEAVVRLARDAGMRRAMGAANAAKARARYSIARIAAEFGQLYERLL